MAKITVYTAAKMLEIFNASIVAARQVSGDIILTNRGGVDFNLGSFKGDPGASNELSIGTVTEGAADASIIGESPNQTLNLVLPKGDTGPANTLVIGTVTEGAANASIIGETPNQTLNLVLPKGNTGDPGPSNTLAIGVVGRGSPAASLTGVSPNQTLNLTLPDAALLPATKISNCNNAKTSGFYYCTQDAPASTNTPPGTNWGALTVKDVWENGAGDDVIQTFQSFATIDTVWTRRYWKANDTWSPWSYLGGTTSRSLASQSFSLIGPGAAYATIYADCEIQLPYGVWDVQGGAQCGIALNNDVLMAHLYNRANNTEIGSVGVASASRGAATWCNVGQTAAVHTARTILTLTDPVNSLRVGVAVHPNGNSQVKLTAAALGPSSWVTAVRIG